MAAFSGRGPTNQESGWRNAPHVVAPGTFVLSTRSTMIHTLLKAWERCPQSSRYFYMGGTSQATALTAGAVALLREHLRTKRGIEEPTAALLKAALIAGASRLGGDRPGSKVVDGEQGYGRVNLAAVVAPQRPMAVRFYDINHGPRTGGSCRYQLDVRSSAHPLRVVLAYTDFPGPGIINNLNLLLTDPNDREYHGNARIDRAGRQDWSNNVEVVHVLEPPQGQWLIEVIGKSVPNPPQDFALVCLGAFGPDRQAKY
jgi:hypothetical protein